MLPDEGPAKRGKRTGADRSYHRLLFTSASTECIRHPREQAHGTAHGLPDLRETAQRHPGIQPAGRRFALAISVVRPVLTGYRLPTVSSWTVCPSPEPNHG